MGGVEQHVGAQGDPLASPVVLPFGDYLWTPATPDAHVIRLSIAFNTTTHVLTGVTIYRSADCAWSKIVVGIGAGGLPDNATFVFDLSGFSGTRSLTPTQMSRAPYNCSTIEDLFNAGQITAVR